MIKELVENFNIWTLRFSDSKRASIYAGLSTLIAVLILSTVVYLGLFHPPILFTLVMVTVLGIFLASIFHSFYMSFLQKFKSDREDLK